ncbi:uncharacterized protein FOMMEDRAFT_146015 [Fomitiporia mediterranea MF3/22]|uniref:uncharacterized protein n=1 Tax=Fomitiporia mediterranea (strain MF3/22) TaxID=694068 RepID=UPI0004408153|nr:uncharacterized protein FOMMEDRAFT_146015 [Fomitiporia mediterranea MF3/22]EJD03871.1 hypothetical protein FOMMEDRAFT_146015 [Fomitiporia mediterranea MF3/22]
MKTIYESSDIFPWDPKQKQKQMFHEHARFLLITPDSQEEDISLLSAEDVLAYAVFRFERDEGRNVVYVYELQTSGGSRRSGLGKALIENLESIGRDFRMSGIMLTHIKLNAEAETFYKSLNFKVDITSPDYEREVTDDSGEGDDDDEKDSDSDDGYSILWRSIQRNK